MNFFSRFLPVFRFGGAIALAPIFEPIGDLGRRETRTFGEFAFFARRRVRIARVPIAQYSARFLLEAIGRLLAVPNRSRQGILASHAILSDGAELASAQTLGFDVVRVEPQLLHSRVIAHGEVIVLENRVEILEVASMERDDGFALENAFVSMQMLADGKAPEKACEPIDVAVLLQHLAHARDLLLGEAKRLRARRRRRGGHRTRSQTSSELILERTGRVALSQRSNDNSSASPDIRHRLAVHILSYGTLG